MGMWEREKEREQITYESFQDALLGGNTGLVMRRQVAQRMLKMCCKLWPAGDDPEAKRRVLRRMVAQQYRKEYGSGIVVMILLQVVLPIVIKLLVEWWMNNRDEREHMIVRWGQSG